ncbi:hypothetical protein [Streptomyces sp. H34-S4]|uniref:hypothetical protein n=1 Tax=Streptomyces sp. H34-S4 TaxID=2996463 RepID=UPI00226F03CF|nr:hypothetical protein [Streptomyces sp. H34-S4]MCY0936132.1 hypothetical protein [Streptomyces sp. H34-S4]
MGTAVVLATVGAITAPAAGAASGGAPGASSPLAVPAEQRAEVAADPGAKAVQDSVPGAGVFQRPNHEFIVWTQDSGSLTQLRVEVRRAGTDEVVAVVDDLVEYYDMGGDSLEPGTWWNQGDSQPLVLDEMGDYEPDVYAKDTAGKELTRRNAGRFTYALDARIEARSSQQEFSLDDLDTQVTGSVTAVHPRTGERLPLSGAMVRARLGWGSADVVSDAQGRFATPVAATGDERTLSQSVALASGDTEVPATAPARIRTQKAMLTLYTKLPLTARYGTERALNGKLTRRADDGTVKPAAHRLVGIPHMVSEFTGPDGSYTLSPRITETGPLGVSVEDSWLTGDGTRTTTVAKVTHTTKFAEEKLASSDKYGRLTISGKVLVDGYTTQQAKIEVQFPISPGRWVTHQSFVVPYNKTFTLTVNPPGGRASEGWRVHTPGSTNIGPSTSTKVIRPTRTETTLTDVRFGPRPVAKGRQLYVSAVLNTYTRTTGSVPYPGQKVRYYFRPDGATVWQEMGTSISLANGAVGKKFTAQASGHWRIRFVDADAAHIVANGTEGRIEVTG